MQIAEEVGQSLGIKLDDRKLFLIINTVVKSSVSVNLN